MGIKFTNNGETTLDGAINTTVLAIRVTSVALFPTITGSGDYFWATVIDQAGNREIVKVTDLTDGTLYTVERGQDDTSGTAFLNGDKFQLRLPKIVLEDFRDDIDNLDAQLAGTTNSLTVPAPSGTIMWFYDSAAIATWTIYTTVEDCLLSVKASSGQYASNIGTGAEAGTAWNALFAHVHEVDAHDHTYAHTHTYRHWHTESGQHKHPITAHTHTITTHRHTIAHTHTVSGTVDETLSSAKDEGSGSNTLARNDHLHTFSVTSGASSSANSGYSGTLTTSSDLTTTDDGTDDVVMNWEIDAGGSNVVTDGQSATTTSEKAANDTQSSYVLSSDRPLSANGILAEKD